MTSIFFVQCIITQLLDSVFVISRIIKVKVGLINRSQRLRLITLTETLIILEITKTSSNDNIVYNFPNRPIAIVDDITSAKKGGSFSVICWLWLYKVTSKKDTKFTYSRPANSTLTILPARQLKRLKWTLQITWNALNEWFLILLKQ